MALPLLLATWEGRGREKCLKDNEDGGEVDERVELPH